MKLLKWIVVQLARRNECWPMRRPLTLKDWPEGRAARLAKWRAAIQDQRARKYPFRKRA